MSGRPERKSSTLFGIEQILAEKSIMSFVEKFGTIATRYCTAASMHHVPRHSRLRGCCTEIRVAQPLPALSLHDVHERVMKSGHVAMVTLREDCMKPAATSAESVLSLGRLIPGLSLAISTLVVQH